MLCRDLKHIENQLPAIFRSAAELRSKILCLSVLLLALLPVQSSAALEMGAAAAAPCSVAGATNAKILSLDDHLDLTLADGQVLRLSHLEAAGPTPDDPDLGQRARDWLADWAGSKEISYVKLETRPDRWGRYAALLFTPRDSSGAPPISAGEALVLRGFARVVPDQQKNPCEKQLLLAEKTAREAGLGLWADPYYKIIPADDGAALHEHAANFVLAEGRLTEVRDSSARSTLFFGLRRRGHLVVTVLQRNVKIFEAAGLHFHGLIGQTLRVRGLLETRFGPEIEVANPSAVELVLDGHGETAKPVQKALEARP